MASWADAAAKLTEAQRWEVLCLYRHYRHGRAPVEALALLSSVLTARCAASAVAGDWPAVARYAHQYAYQQVLKNQLAFRESPAMSRLRRL